ncbi:MAG: class II aldolase/adducin family protein, partial [Paracoccaceae bacterium]
MVVKRWSDREAGKRADDVGADPIERQLALQIYASQLIGGDPELVQHGGGNTSCKLLRKDLFGNDVMVLHIKASGYDLAQLSAQGMPAVRLDGLLALRALERLEDADMVNAVRQNLMNSDAPNPSIEILLHAYLPHPFVNHTHATAMLALANLPGAEAAVQEIFGDTVACVPFHKPGFALARAAAEIYEANPDVGGLLLLNHGHFAFGASPKDAYELVIKHTNMVEGWLKSKRGKRPKARAASKSVAR